MPRVASSELTWKIWELSALFENLISTVRAQCKLDRLENDLMRVKIRSEALESTISTQLIKSKRMNAETIFSVVSNVLQSNEGLSLDRSFVIDIVGLKQPVGGSPFPHSFNKEDNFDYVGPLSDLKYYQLEILSPEATRAKISQPVRCCFQQD